MLGSVLHVVLLAQLMAIFSFSPAALFPSSRGLFSAVTPASRLHLVLPINSADELEAVVAKQSSKAIVIDFQKSKCLPCIK
jgi:hypothetical protein